MTYHAFRFGSHASFRSALKSVFVCILFTWSTLSHCRADLYADTVASLEWKVDSADEVFLASVIQAPTDSNQLKFKPTTSLKSNWSLESFPHESVRHCQLGPAFEAKGKQKLLGSEWIIFVRGDEQESRIAGAINLTQPTARSLTAAITVTADGNCVVLTDPSKIINRVKRRIELDRDLPIDCDPDLTDQLFSHRLSGKPLGMWFGAKLIDASIETWDSPNENGDDFDTLITGLLVPLDIPESPTGKDLRIDNLHELDTVLMSPSTAKFFRNGDPKTNDSSLVGTWKAELKDFDLIITLQPRYTFLVLLEQKPDVEIELLKERGGWIFGAGTWSAGADRLKLSFSNHVENRWQRGHSWSAGFPGPAPFTAGKFTTLNDNEIQFDDGTKFVRQSDRLKVHDYPHEHPWYRISEGWGMHRSSHWIRVYSVSEDGAKRETLQDLVFRRRTRGNPRLQGAPRPSRPEVVKIELTDQGFVPRVGKLRAGDVLEIEAKDSRPIVDHNINISWINNSFRGFHDRLQAPLIYRRVVEEEEPVLIPIRCNIHDDECGYFVVTEDGNIAISDANGDAKLLDWPIGEQRVRIEHPDYDLREAELFLNGKKIDNQRSNFLLINTEDNGYSELEIRNLIERK